MTKELFKGITKEQLEKLLTDSWERNTDLIRWLYFNHKKVLREYEKTKGKLNVEFL